MEARGSVRVWVRVGCVLERDGSRERGSREGRVRKWRGDREEVDRVGEMTVIENDVFTLYCY